MRKWSADYVYTCDRDPIKNGVVVTNDDGRIINVVDPGKETISYDDVKIYNGVLCPGFINAHCHLELSYLKGVISEKTSLPNFITEVIKQRGAFTEKERTASIRLADKEMFDNGIVAVGDISNGDSSFSQKLKSRIIYHTFVEVFGLDQAEARNIIKKADELKNKYPNQKYISITPHAPYSVSTALKKCVDSLDNDFLTIHNQETKSENELFKYGSGQLKDTLTGISPVVKNWKPTGKNSLPSYIEHFSTQKRVQFVHNTYTEKSDIKAANACFDEVFWCFCPGANEYIEGKQPVYELFLDEKCTIGTDSYASNKSLSILDELKYISKTNPSLPLPKMLHWATINGAEFLGFDERLGTLTSGKIPGINLITMVKDQRLTQQSSVKKII